MSICHVCVGRYGVRVPVEYFALFNKQNSHLLDQLNERRHEYHKKLITWNLQLDLARVKLHHLSI